MSHEEPLRVGILGAANIARKNIRAISKTDKAEVVAVGSRDISKAQAMVDEWGLSGATAYASYGEVLDDPRVEAVYIPLPTSLHLEWVAAAAAKGKHVLCEKPLALTPTELDAIIAAIMPLNICFMDGTMWMHHPRKIEMDKVLRGGALGELRCASATFTFTAWPGFENDVRSKKDLDGLGALGDIGWYCVRGILWAFDYEHPTAIAAHPGAVYNAEGVLVSVGATLLFKSGRQGHFQCGFDRALTQKLEISGTKGTLAVDGFVIPKGQERTEFVVTRDHGLGEVDSFDSTQQDVHVVYNAKPQETLMWDAFADCVRGTNEGDPRWWLEVAALTQRVLYAVADSAAAGGALVRFD